MSDNEGIHKDSIKGALQENILTLLCFDDEAAPFIVNSVDVGLFESDIYKDLANQAKEYYFQFKQTPKEHLADLVEDKLDANKDSRRADLYQKILINLYEFKDDINREYVLSKIRDFVKQQRLKSAIVDAVNNIKDGDIEQAESTIEKALRSNIDVFEPGLNFNKPAQVLTAFEDITPAFLTGIKPLDDIGFGPVPGELLVILAPANRGKTWMMVHLGKFGVLQRLKVLHLSLEMSEEKMAQRYLQTFFALGKRKKDIRYAEFMHDEMGRMMDLTFTDIERPTLSDQGIETLIHDKLKRFDNRLPLRIKRFPTNSLTVRGLETYLDQMERYEHFTPDLLIVDYADLMQLSSTNLRIETGNLYKELRRIAVERNIAVATASQANRLAEDARVISLKHLAEDYSKAATADNIIAYCQTGAELKFNLARLFIAKARDEEREQSVLISQAYRMGQFCVGATRMSDSYWDRLDGLAGTRSAQEVEEASADTPDPEPGKNRRLRSRPTNNE